MYKIVIIENKCYLILFFIVFVIVCDDFFVLFFEVIFEKLDFFEDVVGVIFMVVGFFVLELFIFVVGVMVESDVGIGIIVGLEEFFVFFCYKYV